MKRTIAVFALLILIALVVVFRGKTGDLPGMVDLTPSSNAGAAGTAAPAAGGAPSSGTPGRTGAPAPVGPAPAPSAEQGLPTAARDLIHSPDAKLVRGQGEVGAINAHAQFVAAADTKPLLAAAARVATRTVECIKSGACKEAPPENRAYFDPENTSPQRLLAQSLRLLLEGSNAGALRGEVPIGEGSLFDIVRNGNEESRLLALELLLKNGSDSGQGERLDHYGPMALAGGHGMSPELFDRVLAEREHFQGESGRMFYGLLRESTDGSQVLRSHFMEALSDTWSNGDSGTVLELVRHADQLGLSAQEYAQSVAKLCRFKASGLPKANWRAIQHHLENVRTNRGFQLGPKAICKA